MRPIEHPWDVHIVPSPTTLDFTSPALELAGKRPDITKEGGDRESSL